MTRPVLLATDGSPTAGEATREAIQLAAALEASLVIVTAWNLTVTPYGPVPTGSAPVDDHVRGEAEAILEATRERAEEAGLAVTTFCERGNPVEVISELARERNAQLIVIGSHGWGPVRRFLFGSVSAGVLHDSPCPVLVARPADEALHAAA